MKSEEECLAYYKLRDHVIKAETTEDLRKILDFISVQLDAYKHGLIIRGVTNESRYNQNR